MTDYGTLYLCATPIGNLGDISERCLKTLSEVDLIAAEDTRQTLKLLNHFEINTKMTSYYEHNKKEKGMLLINMLKEGKNIAIVSDAGTPAISDPGEDLVKLCIEHRIKVSPVPGAVAGISALICSGLPTGRFCFEGFLSMNRRQRKLHLEEVKNEKRTMIFYEAPHKLRQTLKDFYETFGNRRICIARELTKKFEEIVLTDLESANEKYEEDIPKGEFVLIIEGKSEEEEKSFFENMSIAEHVLMYQKRGMGETDAMKAAAKDRGLRKSDIYNELKKK